MKAATVGDLSHYDWPRWQARLAKLYLAIILALALASFADNFAAAAGLIERGGDWRGVGTPRAELGAGWVEYASVPPGSALAQAGVRPGDQVRMDAPFETFRHRLAGQKLGLTIYRGGQRSHHELVVPPPAQDQVSLGLRETALLISVSGFITMGLGLLLLWRRWSDKGAICLGLILMAFGMPFAASPAWVTSNLGVLAWAGTIATTWTLFSLMPAFCHYASRTGYEIRQNRAVKGWFIGGSLITLIGLGFSLAGIPFPLFGTFRNAYIPLQFGSMMLGGWCLTVNYRDNDAAGRNRIKMIAAAFSLYTLVILLLSPLPPGTLPAPVVVLLHWTAAVLAVIAPGLLVYAMLRHRLFDVSFVINRTLVYGLVSFILLTAVGLTEWGAKQLVPHSWKEAGPFWNAGIALVLFLTFHRIHHGAEHVIERLFFHEWQKNEERLRDFVASAPDFIATDALCRAFAAELHRFAHSDGVAIYRRGAGQFERAAGRLDKAGPRWRSDDAVFARMRSQRSPVELPRPGSRLPGALALPLLDQGTLIGFALLGPKRDGGAYRPDEIDLLGWAAHQVGLDLQALRARELEAEVARLEAQNRKLSELLIAAAQGRA